MPSESPAEWYSYALIRVVPRVERGEQINAGVILFVRSTGFLAASIELDRDLLLAMDSDADVSLIECHLEIGRQIAAGDPRGGAMALHPPSERFHWLTAPRSTIIQPSAVHVGRTADPPAELESLMNRYVRRPSNDVG